MCEFCHEHGEGKKWYLQMKNYSRELLNEKLSTGQKNIVKASTRSKWISRFFKGFALPAIQMNPRSSEDTPQRRDRGTEAQPSIEEILMIQKATHFGQVIPIEDVEQVIDMADSITRFPCGCRYMATGKSDKRYCFGLGRDTLGILGKFPEASSGLEVLEKHEALKMIRDFDQEGLMHSVWTGVTPFVMGLCNCDRDCGAYHNYIENDGIPTFFHAEYICAINLDLCSGCKSCMSQCQFGAMSYSSVLSKVYINEVKCFGCGVCRAACPNGAITLIAREESPKAKDIWVKETKRG